MLFIPIYSDQFRNARRCVDTGFAEILNFHEISAQNLHKNLNMILEQNSYADKVELVSEQFRDNLLDPMEESMYWIEFVARHKHSYPIFKSNAPHIPWYSYTNFDILIVLIIMIYITFAVTKCGLKTIWRRFGNNTNLKEKKK